MWVVRYIGDLSGPGYLPSAPRFCNVSLATPQFPVQALYFLVCMCAVGLGLQQGDVICNSGPSSDMALSFVIQCRLPLVAHFLPFFFFFPPPVPAAAGTGTPPIFTSPASSTFGVATPASCGALRSSIASGRAAISLPSRPKLLTNRPTSAPFVVSYCKHVPDTGSYVFKTKVAVTSSGFDCGGGDDVRDVSAGFAACFVAYFSRFLIFEAEGFRTVYLDVMRV